MLKWSTAVAAALAVLGASAARADEAPKPVEVTGSLTLVSDYRNRGVSLSDNDFALQGGINVSGRKGLSGGVWASTIESTGGSELELDLFAAKSFEIKGTSIAVGGVGYLYPGASNLSYGEATVTVSRPVGPLDMTVGANYAPQQQNLGSRDNIYVYTNAAAPLGSVFKAPVTAAATFGYENGSLGSVHRTDPDIR